MERFKTFITIYATYFSAKMEVNMKKKQINIKYYIANIRIGKKSRDITLYKIEDKNKQRQLYQKYEPLFLTQIDDAVYSYRKGRSNWTAIQKITPLLSQYKYYLVCDIKDFFPSINRKILTQQLNKFIPNNDVKIIMKYVTCCKTGISEGIRKDMRLGKLRCDSKFMAIKFFYENESWSINWMYKQLEISRAAYYKWLPCVLPEQELVNIGLADLIKEYGKRFNHILGYRRMTSVLSELS